MRAVAIHGVHVQVRRVGLGREAIVADVDPGALHRYVRDVERVEEVGVLGKDAGFGGLGSADDIPECNVLS